MLHVLVPTTLSLCQIRKHVKPNALRCSIDVVLKVKTIGAFHSGGNVMAKKTAKMVMTKEISVLKGNVLQVNSSARTKIVL